MKPGDYIPIPCPFCGRWRLIWEEEPEDPSQPIVCEKCGYDGSWLPDSFRRPNESDEDFRTRGGNA